MGMTVAEKEALQAILKQKINDRIEGLEHEAEADFTEMAEKAQTQAIQLLGFEEEFIQATRMYREYIELQKKLKTLWRSVATKLGTSDPSWHPRTDVMNKVEEKTKVIKNKFMADHPVGQKILTLEKAKSDMLSTIWLATSTKQVKDLFSVLDGLLGHQMTDFEKEVMALEPVKD